MFDFELLEEADGLGDEVGVVFEEGGVEQGGEVAWDVLALLNRVGGGTWKQLLRPSASSAMSGTILVSTLSSLSRSSLGNSNSTSLVRKNLRKKS